MTKSNMNSILLEPTSAKEIECIIKDLKNCSSVGPDEIPVSVVKVASPYICDILSHILNSSMSIGIFPNELKYAKVIPLFKDGDKDLVCNYRPISLLNIFSKIFEKVLYKRLLNFVDKHNILYFNQFGFRARHSTYMPMISMLDKITSAKDQSLYSLALFLDLKKAFDTVQFQILLAKLNWYGIRGTPLKLFESYLSNRKQFVSYNGHDSSYLVIKTGVPQGSILGPLLFLLYINDIGNDLFDFFFFLLETPMLCIPIQV